MNGATKTTGRASERTSANTLKSAQYALIGLFLVAIVWSIAHMFVSTRPIISQRVLDAIILVLALASTLISMAGQLPGQNVLLASVIVAGIGGGIHTLEAFTGIPFGPVVFTHESGLLLFHALPWFIPLLWVLVILNARGVARLILRPWRKLRVYGYWLIGITALLTLIFVLGLEVFATRVRDYWIWSPTKLPVDWYGAPLSDFLGWLVAALLILGFSTPSLMKKRPSKSTPEFYSLIVWGALQALFVTGSLSQHLLGAAAVSTIACIAVIPFAIRGAKW
jgi:uncharacterized membrane protein